MKTFLMHIGKIIHQNRELFFLLLYCYTQQLTANKLQSLGFLDSNC